MRSLKQLFFFVNGEYQDNVQAGPSGIARSGANDEWSTNGIVHRPFENTTTVGDRTFVGMNNISQYLSEKYNYNPGTLSGIFSGNPFLQDHGPSGLEHQQQQ